MSDPAGKQCPSDKTFRMRFTRLKLLAAVKLGAKLSKRGDVGTTLTRIMRNPAALALAKPIPGNLVQIMHLQIRHRSAGRWSGLRR
jgi:hypothetical protein